MKFLNHLKNVFVAVFPIAIIVVIFDVCVVNLGNINNFLIGFFSLVIGETIFLNSVDNSVVRMGELVASSYRRKHGLIFILLFAIVFGILSSFAEPDMQVLANEISFLGISINKTFFIFLAGLGVGVFCCLGILRSVFNIHIWIIMLVFYGAIFIMALFLPASEVAIAFDSGSASTGVVAAPFLIALCSSVGSKKLDHGRDGHFGLIGIASIGPVFITVLVFLFSSGGSGSVTNFGFESGNLLIDTLISVALAVGPMLLLFFLFQLLFIKVSRHEIRKIIVNALIMAIGLFLMIFGLEFGFVDVGRNIGLFMGNNNLGLVVLVVAGCFGFLLAFAEPAVRVLAKQVEEASNGNLKASFVVFSIALSMFVALALSVLVVVLDWNMTIVLLCVLALSLFLMIFTPNYFVEVAFDSGGVALGPTSSAFLFPLIVGLSSAVGSKSCFGALALLGLVPCVVIQSLGVIFVFKTNSFHIRPSSFRKRLSRSGVDKFSNIENLENTINIKYGDFDDETKK